MPKKIFSTFLLIVHLFNIGGQLVFYIYRECKSEIFFNEQISKNLYKIDDLTEIQLNVTMPVIADWKGYQNLNGCIQFKNTAYNYVKIKMTRKAIYLLCIPNYETTRLNNHNIIYAKQIPDIPVPKKEHVPFGKINLTSYNFPSFSFGFSPHFTEACRIINHYQPEIPDSPIAGPSQPPDTDTFLS